MNKMLFAILFFCFSYAAIADMPPVCNGLPEDQVIHQNLTMPAKNYLISTTTDGDFYSIKVSVPSSYKGLPISAINLNRMTSGKLTLAVRVAYEVTANKATTQHILVAKSEIESIGFNVVYTKYQKCSESYSYIQELRSYNLDDKHPM